MTPEVCKETHMQILRGMSKNVHCCVICNCKIWKYPVFPFRREIFNVYVSFYLYINMHMYICPYPVDIKYDTKNEVDLYVLTYFR